MSAHREAILDAAVDVVAAGGWSAVTMARLAAATGVSRQTVYNEVGSKPALAEAIVSRELDRFLAIVAAAFDRYRGDPVAGVRAAVRGVLQHARENPVTTAVVAGSAGAETDLLPLLTTRGSAVLAGASAAVDAHLLDSGVTLPARPRRALVDAVVRTTLSHVVQPVGSPGAVANGLADVVAAVLSEAPGDVSRR